MGFRFGPQTQVQTTETRQKILRVRCARGSDFMHNSCEKRKVQLTSTWLAKSPVRRPDASVHRDDLEGVMAGGQEILQTHL